MVFLGPLPFVCLFFVTVWGATLMLGHSWLVATATTLFVFSFLAIVGTVWWVAREYFNDRRVWVLDEVELEEPPSTTRTAVQGVLIITADLVVVGRPVGSTLNMNANIQNIPDVVIGRVLHDDLRTAAFV